MPGMALAAPGLNVGRGLNFGLSQWILKPSAWPVTMDIALPKHLGSGQTNRGPQPEAASTILGGLQSHLGLTLQIFGPRRAHRKVQ